MPRKTKGTVVALLSVSILASLSCNSLTRGLPQHFWARDFGQGVEPSDFDPSSCWPKPADYTLDFVNISDASTSKKHVCNADGTITNSSNQEIWVAVYRVNHYGAQTTFGEKWEAGYQSVQPGETVKYGRDHYCAGGECGEGEWYSIRFLSIINASPECRIYNESFEDGKAPESLVGVANPCPWGD